MKTLQFVARVTFIYNLCMIGALLLGMFDFMASKEMKSSIIVSGLFLSIVFNAFIHLWMGVLLIKYRSLKIFKPAWLFIVNFICFIYQIYMVLL